MTSQASSSHPLYVNRFGGQAFPQPYNIQGTNMYAFVLEASMDKLQAVCDKYFNEPAQGAVEYRAAAPFVLLTCNNIRSLRAIDPLNYYQGFVHEEETIFWMLTVAGKREGSKFKAERLAWFLAYVYVNNSPILVSGREVYGYFKQIGDFQFPEPGQAPDFFQTNTLLFKTLERETMGQTATLLEIRRVKQGDSHEAIRAWRSFEDVIKELHHLLKGRFACPTSWKLTFNVLEDLLKLEFPLVALRQLRDISDSTKACYQEIAEAPCKLEHFYGGQLYGFDHFGDQFELTIHNYASQPIVQDLGLKTSDPPDADSHRVPVAISYYLHFDFILKNGTSIWQAP